MNIFTKLKTTGGLTKSEKQIAEFILKDPVRFLSLSTDKICKECYVSAPTIYRLCTKLNIDGLSDLKVHISASIDDYITGNEEFDFNYPVKQNQTYYEVIKSLETDYTKTIASTRDLFDLDQLRYSVNALKRAEQIDIYTSAGNLLFAENFKFQMQEIGVTVNVPEESYMQQLTAASSNEKHIAILISFGGRSAGIAHLAYNLKKTKTPVILITSPDDNPLKKYADYQLYMSYDEHHSNKISSFSTRMTLLYILDTLYTCYYMRDYEENNKKKIRYYHRMTTEDDE